MTRDSKDLRRPAANVIDQRQQQIDPAGKNRTDLNDRSDANRKQPGGSDPGKLERDAEKGSMPANNEPGGVWKPVR